MIILPPVYEFRWGEQDIWYPLDIWYPFPGTTLTLDEVWRSWEEHTYCGTQIIIREVTRVDDD